MFACLSKRAQWSYYSATLRSWGSSFSKSLSPRPAAHQQEKAGKNRKGKAESPPFPLPAGLDEVLMVWKKCLWFGMKTMKVPGNRLWVRRGQPLDNDGGDERSRAGGSYSATGTVLSMFIVPTVTHNHSRNDTDGDSHPLFWMLCLYWLTEYPQWHYEESTFVICFLQMRELKCRES